MRLSDQQKAAVLATRKGRGMAMEKVELVRVASTWACIWFEPEQKPADRWRGLLVKEVRPSPVSEFVGESVYDDSSVVWTGSEFGGKTRRTVVEQLTAEVLR